MIKNSPAQNFQKYFWCPNKKVNCNYIYNSKMKEIGESAMTCPNCNCRICLLCNDILDPEKPHNPNCQSKLYSKLSDKNREWILKNSKDCPMCHTVYEKNQGCNHMTCTVCHPPTHFCYICGNILNNSNPLSHFSDKESKCYNKLWDDEAKNDINNDINNENIENDNNNDENSDEDSKTYENDDSYYDKNNYNSSRNNNNRRSQYNEENLTRIMIDKVSHNNSFRSNNYRNNSYQNYRGTQRRNYYLGYRGKNNGGKNLPFKRNYQ